MLEAKKLLGGFAVLTMALIIIVGGVTAIIEIITILINL